MYRTGREEVGKEKRYRKGREEVEKR